MMVYRDVHQAHNAACLDIGWDPFLITRRRRVTRAALAAMGYDIGAAVYHKRARETAQKHARSEAEQREREERRKEQARADEQRRAGIGRAVTAALQAGLLLADDRIRPEWTDDYEYIHLVRERGGVVVYDHGDLRMAE